MTHAQPHVMKRCRTDANGLKRHQVTVSLFVVKRRHKMSRLMQHDGLKVRWFGIHILCYSLTEMYVNALRPRLNDQAVSILSEATNGENKRNLELSLPQ